MSWLDILYFILIGLNLAVSIYFRRLWKQYYFLYFFIIVLIEIVILYNSHLQQLYNILDILSIFYFGWLVGKKSVYRIGIYSVTFVSLLTAVYFFLFRETTYSIYTGVVFCVDSVLISLLWFMGKINTDEYKIPIYYTQTFWICSSLIFWSLFYLFRMTPMYWFKDVDLNFLNSIKIVFQISTLISYLLFLKALFCKNE